MVTIVIATCNGERFLSRQIDSIIGQSYQQFTILISDDLSNDRTPMIVEAYGREYPLSIEIMRHDKPSGSAQNNFFRLLRAAQDDYVMLSDQDDVWHPQKLRLTLDRMTEMEKKWGKDMPILVHSDLTIVGEKLRLIHKSMASFQKIAHKNTKLRHYLVENNITGSTVMINRALLSYLDETPPVCVMHDWWLGLLAASFGKIAYLDQPLTLYRQHGANQLGARSAKDLRQYWERLHRGRQVKENYRKMFAQAEFLLDHYREKLTPNQIGLLENFLQIPNLSRIKKVRVMVHYRLYKSTIVRTLGQMLSI